MDTVTSPSGSLISPSSATMNPDVRTSPRKSANRHASAIRGHHAMLRHHVRLLTNPFVVFIKPTGNPKTDFPVSPFLRRTWMFAPRRRARMPVRRIKQGRGFQGDAAAWASPWSGRERVSEVIAVRGRGEAPRLYSCSRSLLLFQLPLRGLCQQAQAMLRHHVFLQRLSRPEKKQVKDTSSDFSEKKGPCPWQ